MPFVLYGCHSFTLSPLFLKNTRKIENTLLKQYSYSRLSCDGVAAIQYAAMVNGKLTVRLILTVDLARRVPTAGRWTSPEILKGEAQGGTSESQIPGRQWGKKSQPSLGRAERRIPAPRFSPGRDWSRFQVQAI